MYQALNLRSCFLGYLKYQSKNCSFFLKNSKLYIIYMKKTIFAEAVLLGLLSLMLLLLLNPFHIMMKLMVSSAVLGALVILYVIKFFLIWREKPQDERDLQHRFQSSWTSYSVVSVILFTGVVVESLSGGVDVWLVAAIAGMFLSKLASIVYLEIYK